MSNFSKDSNMNFNNVNNDVLLKEIEALKKSNKRLEEAFIAISKMLELQLELSINSSLKDSKDSEKKVFEKNQVYDPLKLEFERKLKKNKSVIVKNKILEVLEFKGYIELSDLKFFIVDQLKYTSKPSFYRYIKDLELDNVIEKSFLGSKVFVKLKEKNLNSNINSKEQKAF